MQFPFYFRPKLFDCFQSYSVKTLGSDVSAGITVGIIALPMAMAFAIGSGVPPVAGIITAIIAGFLTSLLGGSRLSIGGPTGAFVAIVAGIVLEYGFASLLICTIMAGAMLFLMGVFRLGVLIRYIPAPLVKGFTTGIALTILVSQAKDFLGLDVEIDASNVVSTLTSLAPHLGETDLPTFGFGVTCLAAILLWPRKIRRYLPSSIIVLCLATVAAVFIPESISLATIGSRFGEIPQTLTMPHLPDFDLEKFQHLLAPAMTIALLGAIESLLCATAADGMTRDHHDPDQELMGQGIANMITPLFGGIPATGAIARTAANIRNGGKTPVSGMVHAVTLLLIMLIAGSLAIYIPLAVLSAILIVVAINMGDWREFLNLRRYPKSDATVFLLTFLLTVIFGLTQAVTVGMFAACVLFMRRISEQSRVGIRLVNHSSLSPQGQGNTVLPQEDGYLAHDDVLLVNISGAMFFGASQKLQRILRYVDQTHRVIVFRMSQVLSLDATALMTLEDLIAKARQHEMHIIFYGLDNQPLTSLRRSGLLKGVPEENIVPDRESAMNRAVAIIEEEDAAKELA